MFWLSVVGISTSWKLSVSQFWRRASPKDWSRKWWHSLSSSCLEIHQASRSITHQNGKTWKFCNKSVCKSTGKVGFYNQYHDTAGHTDRGGGGGATAAAAGPATAGASGPQVNLSPSPSYADATKPKFWPMILPKETMLLRKFWLLRTRWNLMVCGWRVSPIKHTCLPESLILNGMQW